MARPGPVVGSADPRREIPESAAARLDRIEAALLSIGDEQRRLQRLGFETPLAHCHQQRRYWQFLRALFSIPHVPPPRRPATEGPSWPDDPSR
jgi:hypothetical protein